MIELSVGCPDVASYEKLCGQFVGDRPFRTFKWKPGNSWKMMAATIISELKSEEGKKLISKTLPGFPIASTQSSSTQDIKTSRIKLDQSTTVWGLISYASIKDVSFGPFNVTKCDTNLVIKPICHTFHVNYTHVSPYFGKQQLKNY